jgi:FkbM family methyltransferase
MRGLNWRYRLGLIRSLVIYWRPGRQRGLRRLYAGFINPGDRVFDIGAHVGDRSVAFAALGARVVALEPQPQLRPLLDYMVEHRSVTVLGDAVGARPGWAELAVSPGHPTVSSLSTPWRAAMREAHAGFQRVHWSKTVRVPVVTLDQLIDDFGQPAFCKIDVEGFEEQVLAGLSLPISALSFEFVAGALEAARRCLDRLSELGDYRYNVVAGEARRWRFRDWQDQAALDAWLVQGADGLASGDVYACLVS